MSKESVEFQEKLKADNAALRERVVELEQNNSEMMRAYNASLAIEADYEVLAERYKASTAECARLEQHLADARVRSEALERQVGEWRTTNANCALELEKEQHARIDLEIERDRYRAAIENAIESLDAVSAPPSLILTDKLRDALGEAK